MSPPPPKKLGQAQTTALVVGNMIGSGVFLLPASLASFGGASLIGWVLTSCGAILLALVFATLSRNLAAAGGPYAYSRLGFGDFIGFWVAWGYWIAIWCGNAAIAVAFVSYFADLVPAVEKHPFGGALTGIVAIWLLTWVNSRGVQVAGQVQLVTTVLKVLPLVVVGVFGLTAFDPALIRWPTEGGPISWLFGSATLTLWAFLGLETATIPADNVKDPEKTIPRATLWGTLIAAAIYIVSTTTILGLIPAAELAKSQAPFADAAKLLLGPGGAIVVGVAAAISAFGALNGWILVQGQLPQAAARDGLMPAIFARSSARGVPLVGLIISSVLMSLLLAMNYSATLVEQFTFIILLATLANLIPYVFGSAALLVLLVREPEKFSGERIGRQLLIGFLAFLYSLAAIAGAGQEAVFWGFLLLLAGLPVYVWLVRKVDRKVDKV
jgi:basic amino acid/polyamine antiporter, APA family